MQTVQLLDINIEHPDLAILCAKTNTSPSDLRSAMSPNKEFNYLKVNSLRYWEPSDIEALKQQIAAANQETHEYEFKLHDITDFEVEYDNDRTWPASFSFESHKK